MLGSRIKKIKKTSCKVYCIKSQYKTYALGQFKNKFYPTNSDGKAYGEQWIPGNDMKKWWKILVNGNKYFHCNVTKYLQLYVLNIQEPSF